METNNKERRRYSEELKKRVAKEFETGKMNQGELTRLYGLRRGAIEARILELVGLERKENSHEWERERFM